MPFVRRTRKRFVAAYLLATGAAACALGGACVSPTLPLPPPETPGTIQAAGDGLWRISGFCSPGALVTVLNEDTGAGVVVEDREGDGRYAVELEAEECDLASVSQANEEGLSGDTTFVIFETSVAEPGDPSICQ